MMAKTLDVQVIPSSDPCLLVTSTERDILKAALKAAVACRRGEREGAWYAMIDFYRSCMTRGRSALSHRKLQSLLGVFEDGADFENYAEFAECSIEEAVYTGLVLAAERIRAVLDQVADDFQEAVIGPTDDHLQEVDEGDNIVDALILKLTLHWQAAEKARAAAGHQVFAEHMPAGSSQYVLSLVTVSQTVVCAIIRPISGFLLMNAPSAMPSINAATDAMYDSWVAELFLHLSDPEILAVRRPQKPAVSEGVEGIVDEVPRQFPGLFAGPAPSVGPLFAKKKTWPF